MELILIRSAVFFYAAATALAFAYLFLKKESFSAWMFKLLSLGLILHLSGFGLRLGAFWSAAGHRYYLPVNSFFGALSFMALAGSLVFFLIEREHRLGILGAFVLPWISLAAGAAAFWADPALVGLSASLRSPWINMHPILLMTAYAAFANAFGVGLALLIQERQIKSRRPTPLCYRLPSIEDLDILNSRIIAAAFPILVLGLVTGGVWAHEAWGRFWGWDPKETWALITAVLYAVFLYMRYVGGLRGRRAVYVSMAGFAAVLFTFAGVDFLSELHGYLSNPG